MTQQSCMYAFTQNGSICLHKGTLKVFTADIFIVVKTWKQKNLKVHQLVNS